MIVLKNKKSCIKVGELMEVLRDKRFEGDSPIIVHSRDGSPRELIAVVRCGSEICNSPHLIAIPVGAKEIKMKFSGREEFVVRKTPDIINGEFDVIENDELVAALEKFNKDEIVAIRVDIDSPQNDETHYSELLSVLKCSAECPAIHLHAGYDTNEKGEYYQEGDEKSDDDDGGEIIMKNKIIDGEYVNVGELLESLESKHFNDDAAIMINSISNASKDSNEPLTVVTKCSCGHLHLIGGKAESDKKITLRGVIFINHLRDSSSVKKRDLIPVLKRLDPHTTVSMQNVGDADCSDCSDYFTLQSVLKCRPTCPIVHLGISHWGGRDYGGGAAEIGAAKLN